MIHLIRHAEPAITGVLLGRTDPPLADVVVRQVELAAAVVYVSPLRRAVESAERMFPGREYQLRPALAERDMGQWDGLAWAEIERLWPAESQEALADWRAFTPPDGEPWPQFAGRVKAVFEEIRQFPSCAVVAHLGVNAALWELAGAGTAMEFMQEYTEVRSIAI